MGWLIFLAAQALAVEIERLNETSFLLNASADAGTTAAQAQARTAAAARQACGARRPVLGRFRFVAESRRTRFEQELLCLHDRHRITLIDTAASGGELSPTMDDQHAVLAASYAYFTAKDRAQYPAAHAFLSDRTRAQFPLPEWIGSARAFNAEAGPVRGRRVIEITWYKDPQDAPEPGLYVAADFSAEFERAEFVCGYLMWRIQPDHSLRLTREEQNMAPTRPSGRPIAEIDRDPLRTRMGCKD